MRNLILILTMMMGLFSQAQSFDFLCSQSNVEESTFGFEVSIIVDGQSPTYASFSLDGGTYTDIGYDSEGNLSITYTKANISEGDHIVRYRTYFEDGSFSEGSTSFNYDIPDPESIEFTSSPEDVELDGGNQDVTVNYVINNRVSEQAVASLSIDGESSLNFVHTSGSVVVTMDRAGTYELTITTSEDTQSISWEVTNPTPAGAFQDYFTFSGSVSTGRLGYFHLVYTFEVPQQYRNADGNLDFDILLYYNGERLSFRASLFTRGGTIWGLGSHNYRGTIDANSGVTNPDPSLIEMRVLLGGEEVFRQLGI